mgnify:CR=1 FL=1
MNKIVYLLLSIIITLLFFLSKGIVIIILCGIIAGYILSKKAASDNEKIFLKRIYFFAFVLGIIISSANFYLAAFIKNDSDLIGDASAYSSHGAYIAEVLTNKRIKVENNYIDMLELNETRSKYGGKLPVYEDYRIGFFAYFYGYIYALFGYSPLIIKYLNLILGIIGCFLIYFWVRDVFGEKQAKLSLFLTLFLPSRFIWSTSGLKDTLVFFSFSLMLFIFFKLQRTNSLLLSAVIIFAAFINYASVYIYIPTTFINYASTYVYIPIILILFFYRKKIISLFSSFIFMKLAYVLVHSIRIHFIEPVTVSLVASLITLLKRGKIFLLAVFIPLLLFALFEVDKDSLKNYYRSGAMIMIEAHKGQALAGEYAMSKYKIYPQRFYDNSISIHDRQSMSISFKELFISYLFGMSYHFLSPFPWTLNSKGLIFGYIQSVYVYILLPFIVIGIMIGFRYHWRKTFPYFLLILMIGSMNSLFLGNMGTLFRHRDMVMPFFIAFGAIGLTHIIKMPRIGYER